MIELYHIIGNSRTDRFSIDNPLNELEFHDLESIRLVDTVIHQIPYYSNIYVCSEDDFSTLLYRANIVKTNNPIDPTASKPVYLEDK